MKNYIIDDTTLRDGEQTPGVSFSLAEKLEIARGLDKIGVQEIEAGIPVMGEEESRVFSKIVDLGLSARIIAWNRALISDVQASINAGADSVEISLPLSDIQIKTKLNKDRTWVKDQIKRVMDFCASKNLYVSVGGEDASRADISFVTEYAKIVKEHGGARFRYCDTVGILDPFSTYETVKRIIDETGIDVEIHAHNDFGLATANSLAAIRAGATHVNTTVIGLGERAGNAPLEEIVMASRHVYRLEDGFDHSCIKSLSEYVSKASGRAIEPYRPVIGELMFTHESGIHTDGILKNPNNYEAFDPAELGMERKLVVGKHSGRGILEYILQAHGLEYTPDTVKNLLEAAKKISGSKKRYLNNNEVIELYKSIAI
ncbi:MAG TPA: homocitrate synthase [Deferribacteraceae bacterium]|nr:homocitrate synthase [Deferribacteraceae bacterium]